jgi:hypothetical protein
MSAYVGAQHEFHDASFVRGWANRFVPTPERLALQSSIRGDLRTMPASWRYGNGAMP